MTKPIAWTNYFVTSLAADNTQGHLPAEFLSDRILHHDGAEAYHCAFDVDGSLLKLEEMTSQLDAKGRPIKKFHAQSTGLDLPRTFAQYEGVMRPSLGYVWFDFDSKDDGGAQAFVEAKAFLSRLEGVKCFTKYSGSKGFHIGVPFSAFYLKESDDLGAQLNLLASKLKKTFPTLDTTVFNANRKFRALGSRHPKTGLFCRVVEMSGTLEGMKALAQDRGPLEIEPPDEYQPHPFLDVGSVTPKGDSISFEDFKKYRQAGGLEAFNQCGFLAHCRDNAASIDEPQWYAAASIVGRFKDGKAQFHEMSKAHPHYSVADCDQKLEQAVRASGPRTCRGIDALWDGCKKCPLYQKITSPVAIMEKDVIATEATGFYSWIVSKDRPPKPVPNYNDLLRCFQRDMPYRTIADMKTVYVFRSTHYEEFTPIEIKSFAEEKFAPKPPEKVRQEFCHKVFANSIAKRSFFTATTENKINFRNGVLDLQRSSDRRGLDAHSSDFGFRHCLPYEFNPDAESPLFNSWLKDVMLGDADLIDILQEYMGYVIRGGDYKYHKALWLSGSGRNGKSTFLSVLKALIGNGNYSTLSIRQIINDKFSSADLDGKIANFSEETSPEELSDSGPFKNLTGDGELLAQKKYGDPYSFRNRAKLIMTYNEIPMLKDLSVGMQSRPIIVPWNKTIEGHNQDRNLKAKLLQELPGIFNFALAGWDRLERNEDFTPSLKSQLAMQNIVESSCSAFQFIEDALDFLPLDLTYHTLSPNELFKAYEAHVGRYPYNKMKFFKRIAMHPEIKKRRKDGFKSTVYFALRLK